MSVTVSLPAVICGPVAAPTTLQARSGIVRDVFEELVGKHPELKPRLLSPGGDLHRFVNVYVDGEDVRLLEGIDTYVKEGARVSVLSAVAGG